MFIAKSSLLIVLLFLGGCCPNHYYCEKKVFTATAIACDADNCGKKPYADAAGK
jgi:hypothetical protein